MSAPNVLLITTDQQRHDTIASAGNPAIFTPHLDWLRDGGLHFTRCYSDCPVCMPARATIMTGRHAFNLGITGNTNQVRPIEGRPTLPGLLTGAGYQSRAVGKMHFEPMRAHYGFEHMVLADDYRRHMLRNPQFGRPLAHGMGQCEMQPVFSTVPEEHSSTHWTAEQTVDFLETRDPTRPFFCWTSFGKPHQPFDCDLKYWHLYDGIDLPEPIHGDWSRTVDDVPPAMMRGTWGYHQSHRFSSQQWRNVIRAYYACITQIDYNLGLIFARLIELGLLDNTWIIFTADHGETLGDHWIGSKDTFLEGSTHVPLLVRPPDSWSASKQRGIDEDRLACLADLLPTVLGIAGIEPPEADGLDLFGDRTRGGLHGACGDLFAWIEPTVKYHFALRGHDELLFDTAPDPYEQHNRIHDPAWAEARQRGRDRVLELLQRIRPEVCEHGQILDPGPATQERELACRSCRGFHSLHRPSDLLH